MDLIGDLAIELWFESIKCFNGLCTYSENEGYFFFPLSKKGIDSKNNVIPACESYNALGIYI